MSNAHITSTPQHKAWPLNLRRDEIAGVGLYQALPVQDSVASKARVWLMEKASVGIPAT